MKKMACLSLALIILFMLTACGNKSYTPAPLTDGDFIVKNGDEFINLGEKYENTIIIDSSTPFLETSRGIKVGDSISNVFEKYGTVYATAPGHFHYNYEDKHLSFYFDKYEIITEIRVFILNPDFEGVE
jgi:uncharacterized lipoprotein YehR (DUF1307 family)